jgi:hypothetical protein
MKLKRRNQELLLLAAAVVLIVAFALIFGMGMKPARKPPKSFSTGVMYNLNYTLAYSIDTSPYLGQQFDDIEFYTLTGGGHKYYFGLAPFADVTPLLKIFNKTPEDFWWTEHKWVYDTHSRWDGSMDPKTCWITYDKANVTVKKFACLTMKDTDKVAYRGLLAKLVAKYPPLEPLKADYWNHDIPERYLDWEVR